LKDYFFLFALFCLTNESYVCEKTYDGIIKLTIKDEVLVISKNSFCTNYRNDEIESITLKNVRTIGRNAFEEMKKLTSLNMDNSVVEINERAFYKCKNLKNFKFSENLETIESYAFANNEEMTNIYLDNTKVNKIGSFAFAYGTITYVYLPSTLKEIGANAFYDTPVESVVFFGDEEPKCDFNVFDPSHLSNLVIRVPISYTDDDFCGVKSLDIEEQIKKAASSLAAVIIIIVVIVIVVSIISFLIVKCRRKVHEIAYQKVEEAPTIKNFIKIDNADFIVCN